MLDIEFEFETVNDLSQLNERIKAAVADKLIELTQVAYNKVVENLSGKVLQKQTGALLDKVSRGVDIDTTSNPMHSFVGPVNPGPKEYALELGGKGSYTIHAKEALYLHFFWKKEGRWFTGLTVNHPASKEFGYLRLAGEEMRELVPEGFREAIDRVLRGGI